MKFDKIYKQTILEADQSDLLNQMVSGDEDNANQGEPTSEPSTPDETPETEATPDENDTENPDELNDDETQEEPNEDDSTEVDEQDEKKKEQEEKQRRDEERQQRLNSYVDQVISDLKFQIDKNPKMILGDFRTYGAEETAKRFIENTFIPTLKDSDEKVFLTLNIDEFATMVSDKLSDKFLQTK